MFDTGLGLVPIRPVIEQLTSLPVEVINSHTHYDHVGGNAEFDRILAMDTPYTHANAAGFAHADLAGEVAPSFLCGAAPAGADIADFHTRPWHPSRFVADGEQIDLGGRKVEVLRVPGHTPDAVALIDRTHGYLWTGDTYYDATIWLYVPETDLDDYERSLGKLVALAPGLTKLFPGHNTATADPAQLAKAADAIARVRARAVSGAEESGNRLVFHFDRFNILVSKPALEGRKGDKTRGGSGLTTWP
jgi:glyoxylase-like metal-dependent hydrolase (beta-lactamase superfamily II)